MKNAPSRSRATSLLLFLILGALARPEWAAPIDVATSLPPEVTSTQERRLVESLVALRAGDLEGASARLEALVERQPDFRLAHLIRGDLWRAQAGGITGFGEGLADESERVADLLFEARARWKRFQEAPPARALPEGLLRLADAAPSVLVIDLKENRLFVFERQEQRLVKTGDYYASIGKKGSEKQVEGDERTPVGYYLVSSYLDGKGLPDLYGVGAYPINYPNGWDKLHGRTGSGIWIHGTESTTYSRPPRSSRGCVTLSNEDFARLMSSVHIEKTPVLVTDGFDWIAIEQSEPWRQRLEERIEAWRQAWESRDTARYLDFYSDSFQTQSMDRNQFGAHKRRVNGGKRFIRVKLDELGIYGYPGESDVVVVDFVQHYESDSFRSTGRKHQYWRREADGWRIVFEELI